MFLNILRISSSDVLEFKEPLFNELLGITNNIFRPGKSYSKKYGTEPRFNELLDFNNEPIPAAQT